MKITTEQDAVVLKTLNDTLKSSYHNLAFYDAISEYVVIRYNTHSETLSTDSIKTLIYTILDKLISRNLGRYEVIAIVNRGLANIFQ